MRRTLSAIARTLGGLSLLLGAACQPSPPSARVPSLSEASSEIVVVNYAPQRLRVLPAGTSEGGYLLLGSERPLLPAVFRPLGVTTRKVPKEAHSRAGELAWVGGHVVAAPPLSGPAQAVAKTTLLVYDTDSKVATPTPVALPAPCTQTEPLLLHSDGHELQALVRCPSQNTAMVLRLSATGERLAARVISGAGAAELLVHAGDVDYLLAGRQVIRADAAGQKVSVPLPLPGNSGPDTRDLVLAGGLLVVLDGGSGQVSALDREQLGLRFTHRLYRGHPVTRLRAALSGPERLIVTVAEQQGPALPAATGTSQLVAVALPLAKKDQSSDFPTRILLGSGPSPSDHELVPIAPSDGGGVLLVRTHAGNSGPLVALLRLSL